MQTSNSSKLTRFMMLCMSALAGLLITEFLIRTVVGYPTYGIKYKVHYRNGAETWTNIRKAHAEQFNVEGRTKTKYNNYGLPGIDISHLDGCVVVLGSSFVEALQIQPENMATTLFQKNLKKKGALNQVINLGCSGHDPYDSWFRLQYYEKALGIDTEDVILVINSDNRSWLTRHKSPLDFDLFHGFGEINQERTTGLMILARNTSALVELVAATLKTGRSKDRNVGISVQTSRKLIPDAGVMTPEFVDILNAFDRKYEEFRVISIVNLPSFNHSLTEFCLSKNIPCQVEILLKPELRIGMSGHLNSKGNKALGDALTRLFYNNISSEGV